MIRVARLGWLAYGLAALVIVSDQVSKYWILYVFDLPTRGSWPVTDFFYLSMVWNRGVSFGLLRAEQDLTRWGLAAFSLVVAALLIVWARGANRRMLAVGLGLVIGGALGNLVDRVRLGAVVDFLDFSGLYFPWVFNIADSAITVGVILLMVDSFLPAHARR